jgi:serine/threonine protein kinase
MNQLDSIQHPTLSSQIGTYQLQQELGRNREGGRITYLATHMLTEQSVVLKQFRFVQTDTTWSGYKSYEREIEILQAITHPQIPAYLDSFETEDGFCMVQEYKNAPSLTDRPHLTPLQIQQVALSVLGILIDLQQQVPPIIHRDIKPENILVDDNLQAYLIDFGLAKLNHETIAISSVAAGTPGFMPPEELFNRPLNESADLYSLGATLICLLTGIPSAQISELIDENYQFSFKSHLPIVSSKFADWLQTMVEPNPRDRFQDAAAALEALKIIDIEDLTHPSTTVSDQPSRFLNRPISFKTVAVILLGCIAGIPLLARLIVQEQPQPQPVTAAVLGPEQQWFETVKPHCNTLEVITTIHNNPYPATSLGVGYGASCYALAGKLPLADRAIQSLPLGAQAYAAGVLFEIGHPVADRGDDESAGPIMDLVLKYWPDNYMARYHAGMSAYVLAENEKAVAHLKEFLKIYQADDNWRKTAILAIDNIKKGIPANNRFKVHH